MVVRYLVDVALDTTVMKDGKYLTEFTTMRVIKNRIPKLSSDEVKRLRKALLDEGLHTLVWHCGMERL